MNSHSVMPITIPRRAHICTHGQEPFQPGTEYFSILIPGDHEHTYIRQDYCPTCWRTCTERKALPPMRSSWKAVIPKKPEASPLPKQRDARALVLLKESIALNDRALDAEIFVLSLYLARRRRLLLRQELVLEDGQSASIYEVPETEEMVCVHKVALSSLEVDKLQTALAKKFNE